MGWVGHGEHYAAFSRLGRLCLLSGEPSLRPLNPPCHPDENAKRCFHNLSALQKSSLFMIFMPKNQKHGLHCFSHYDHCPICRPSRSLPRHAKDQLVQEPQSATSSPRQIWCLKMNEISIHRFSIDLSIIFHCIPMKVHGSPSQKFQLAGLNHLQRHNISWSSHPSL